MLKKKAILEKQNEIRATVGFDDPMSKQWIYIIRNNSGK